jgi:ankyrin repeat protein
MKMRILPVFRPHALLLHRNEADEQRLVRYVRERRHMDALYLLLSQQKTKKKTTESPSSGGDDKGGPASSSANAPSAAAAELLVRRADRLVDAESFLHYVLQNQPTADLVDYVLNLGGGGGGSTAAAAAIAGASGGQGTILHTAVANGCSRSVVETILYDHNGLNQARSPDDVGRYPLHWACVNPRKAKKQVCHTVVELLLSVYPEAQDIADNSGHTPLDLAKMHRTSGTIVRLLNGGVDDESSTSSSSFLRRASFSSKRRRSHRQSALRRSLTPHTLPDDGASDEGTADNEPDDNHLGPQDYRQLYQVMATKARDEEDEDDDDISSLGCDDG